jgi:coenzyme F420-0:L-glutamate ligase/coenzyme F420-1:gamma-L-glutamate ligase
MNITIHPIHGVPAIEPGDDLAAHLFAALDREGLRLSDGDLLVVCQKAVSKAEGRLVDLSGVTPTPFARHVSAAGDGKDPRVIEVILGETKRIVRMEGGRLIVETHAGWVCANAGVDESNSGDPGRVVLLPLDPDASARRIREAARRRYGSRIGVLVTDTFGRPWRQGQLDFALGVAGLRPLRDLRGETDLDGRELRHTVIAEADALAAAAGLVMAKGAGIPAALVRGFRFEPCEEGTGGDLVRPAESDLFR